jgi:hypothetical protein
VQPACGADAHPEERNTTNQLRTHIEQSVHTCMHETKNLVHAQAKER